MSISTDAILFYGYCFDDEEGLPWDGDDGEDDGDGEFRFDRLSGLSGQPYEVRKAAREAAGCEVVIHCSYDYPMYGVALSGSIKRAWRGTPVEIEDLAADDDAADEKLSAYCKLMEIDVGKQTPKWWLVSLMG